MPDYKPEGRVAVAQYGVPWDLFDRLVTQESGWRQYDERGRVLTSPAGAIGLTQLMPATASGLGVNPYDPIDNLRGGARYLADRLHQFGGDVVKAVAAYNMGEGTASGWDRSRSWLHNYRNSRGQYPFRETEQYLDAILGPQWESIPATPGQEEPTPAPRPGHIHIPIPGPDNDIDIELPGFPSLPSFPTATSIGQAIADAFWTPIKAWWASIVARAGDVKTAMIVAGAGLIGINLIIFGLLALAFRSPPAKLVTKIGAAAPNPYVAGGSQVAARFQ